MDAKKKWTVATVALCLVLQMGTPVMAYGAVSEEAQELLSVSSTIPQPDDTGGEDTDAAEKRDKIIAYLRDHLEEAEEDPTVQGGYAIIDAAIREVELNTTVATVWKNYFKEEAMALGIDFESVKYTTVDPDTGLITTGTTGVQKSDVEKAAEKVNILTWNTKTDSQGNSISKINRGMISEILNAFDVQGSLMTSFTRPIQALAIALAITFGCSQLLVMVTDRNLSSEALQREFIKLLFGVWFIYHYRFFTLMIIRMGTLVVSSVQLAIGNHGASSVQYTIVKALNTMLTNSTLTQIEYNWFTNTGASIMNIGSSLSGAFGSLTSLFGNGIVQLASSLVVYAVAIEIAVRYVFTPLAIADLYSERFRSNGWMWLKKLFACALQGAVIYIIIFATDIFKNSLHASFSVITNTAINLTMIGMFAKSRQIANDIIGVH